MPEQQTPAPPAPLAMKDLITEAGLGDRAYLKDYLEKPLDKETGLALLKKLDGAESLVGKKTLIPGADAKPEDWDLFLSKLRPEKPETYQYDFGEKADQDFVKTFREAAHHAGMSQAQMSRQLEKLAPFFQAREKAIADATAARDAEFEKLVTATLGSKDYAAKRDRAAAVVKDLVPKELQPFGEKVADKDLVILTLLTNAIIEKYMPEDEIKKLGAGAGGGGGGDTADSLTAEAHKIYANPAWRDFQHPEHQKLVAREKEIWAHPVFKKT